MVTGMIKGIDVSVWQGIIDWDKVKASGVEFALIRAGYGEKNIDRQFARNISECNRVGIPCGVYWFSYAANEQDAVMEAVYCIEAIKPYKIEYPVCFDFEYESAKYATGKGASVTKAFVTALAKAFCREVEKAGYIACVYTNQDYSINMLDMGSISAYSLWYAWYNENRDRDDIDIWQYSNKGRIDGISGDVDLNYCFKDFVKETKMNKIDMTVSASGHPLDNTPDGYARSAVEKAVGSGILAGDEHGDLMLHSHITRQDMLVILDRLGLIK